MEKAFLVGVQEPGMDSFTAGEHLFELNELVASLGLSVAGELMVTLREPCPRLFIGSGKAGQAVAAAKEKGADCIVVDHELTPSQQRNWEKLSGLPVVDRQEVIIDIFAKRASTKEAVIQVELARLQYLLPRLARAWTHLSRQKGGAMGTRGEGEQQIEVDRRIIKQKIAHYQRELKELKLHRNVQRKQMTRTEIPHAAIVGYTNAGKSTLLNALSGASVLVEDKLFATLDPTTRQIMLLNKQPMLVTDTVGFVRKLPHLLVEAFKSTLEEAVISDFIVHVLDISSPYFEEHYSTTMSVLEELGASGKDVITVLNKADVQTDQVIRLRLKHRFPDGIFISARKGEGIDQLIAAMTAKVRPRTEIIRLRLPPARHDLASLAYSGGKVISTRYDDDGTIHMAASVAKNIVDKFAGYLED